jgi:hypothetical protein
VEPCRWPVIESPFTLLNKEMEVLSGNAIESFQITLRLVPEVLDAVNMVSGVNKLLRVIDAVMSELRDIQGIIAQKAICIDNTIRFYCPSNDRN